MCKTILYAFPCGCPATKRFRNSICDFVDVRGCHIEDSTVHIGYPCDRCFRSGATSNLFGGVENPALDDFWYVPSRCFIDVGFRTLNPFQEDRSKSSASRMSSPPHDDELIPPEMPIPESPATPREKKRLWRRLVNWFTTLTTRNKPHPELSPCCIETARSKSSTPFVGRLEDPESRSSGHYGRIKEDLCQSPF